MTFNTLGARAITLNPGVRATSLPAALALRGAMAAKLAGTLGTIALLNYLFTRRKGGGALGRPGVPLGSIDTGRTDKNGRPEVVNLFNMIGPGRGARVLGLRGFAQAREMGLPASVALDAGARDAINAAFAPWAGPAVKFGLTAAAGSPPGVSLPRTSRVAAPGQSQFRENLKAALEQANPVAAGLVKSRQPGATGWEALNSQLPRILPQPARPPSMMRDYPAIVRRAQANAFIEDVIGQARTMAPESRREFLRQSLQRLDPADRATALYQFRRRKVL